MPRSVTDDDRPKNRIYKELRLAIMMGHRRPGERLSVEDLAECYGASITPIRDVLQRLSEAGLVTIKPRSGYYVASITLKQLRDMLELYEILELASVERAVTRIKDAQIAELEEIEQGLSHREDLLPLQHIEKNGQFHLLIARASGNLELVQMLERVYNRLSRFMIIGSAIDVLHDSHAQIIQALRTRDAQLAHDALHSELQSIRSAILEHVIQTEGDSWFLAS